MVCLGMVSALRAEPDIVSDDPVQEVKCEMHDDRFGEVIVKLKTDRFVPKKHRVTRKNGFGYIDGRRVIGTDGGVRPFMEFVRFEIFWNGKRVPVAHEVFAPIYNAHLNDVTLAVSDRGDAVLIGFVCGDATLQGVWLTIRKDGEWHRFTSEVRS